MLFRNPSLEGTGTEESSGLSKNQPCWSSDVPLVRMARSHSLMKWTPSSGMLGSRELLCELVRPGLLREAAGFVHAVVCDVRD